MQFHIRRFSTHSYIPILAILIASGVMTTSIRRGIEFGDEGYYLQLLLDLERNGLSDSPFRTPHQLAALVQLPLILIFRFFNSGTEDLALFLRSSYQVLSLVAAVMLYFALERRFTRFAATVASLLMCAFIPLYLPTLSYNTLVLCAFTIATTSQFLCLNTDSKWHRYPLAIISCGAWVIGCLAYPTFSIVAVINLLIVLSQARKDPKKKLVSTLMLFFGATTSLLLLRTAGISWFNEVFEYQRALISASRHKEDSGMQLDFFNISVGLPLALIVVSRFISSPLAKMLTVWTALLVTMASDAAPNLPRTHFVITIIGLGFIVQSLVKPKLELFRASCIEYIVLLATALVVTVAVSSSGGTSLNLALGTLIPSSFQLATWLDQTRRIEKVGLNLSVLCLVLRIYQLSYSNHYGDALKDPVKVETGVYRGLTTSRENALLLKDYQEFLERKGLTGSNVVYVGVNSGLLIDSNLNLLQVSPWPIERVAVEHAKLATRYMDVLNPKPDVVLVDSHWYINPFGYQFFCLYQLEESHQLSNGNALEIWRFNNSLPVCPF